MNIKGNASFRKYEFNNLRNITSSDMMLELIVKEVYVLHIKFIIFTFIIIASCKFFAFFI